MRESRFSHFTEWPTNSTNSSCRRYHIRLTRESRITIHTRSHTRRYPKDGTVATAVRDSLLVDACTSRIICTVYVPVSRYTQYNLLSLSQIWPRPRLKSVMLRSLRTLHSESPVRARPRPRQYIFSHRYTYSQPCTARSRHSSGEARTRLPITSRAIPTRDDSCGPPRTISCASPVGLSHSLGKSHLGNGAPRSLSSLRSMQAPLYVSQYPSR